MLKIIFGNRRLLPAIITNPPDTISALQSARAVAFGAARYFGIVLSVRRQLHFQDPLLLVREREDIVLDAVCFPAGVVPGSMRTTMETIKAFREELRVATLLGISNAGHSMPNPRLIDLA